MRSDLDRLMAARELQAIFVVTGDHVDNPMLTYLANGKPVNALAIKKRGEPAVLIAHAMEIEEAAQSGLQVHSLYDFDWAQLIKDAEGNRAKAETAIYGLYFEKFAIPPGKIGIYGVGDINIYIELVKRVQAAYPQYQFIGETGRTLFDEAYVTKDAQELTQIRSVAQRTNAVMEATWAFIAAHRADGDTVMKADGTPFTIGDVKRFVRRTLLDHELLDNDMIFAQGRDGGIPHSRGQADMPLKLGQAIVFDLFPRDMHSGYHHDMTRTWSIEYASDEVQNIYDTVMESFDVAVEMFQSGNPTYRMQEVVQEYFEGKGHPTTRSHPGTTEGYVHSLGHGLGLKVHERPSISDIMRDDIFQPGNVITIEPGLYYPERGYGVRIEDTVYVDESGQLVNLTPFHKRLVLPLEG